MTDQIYSMNGWWDFRLMNENENPSNIPSEGWSEKAYMVPSIWTKSRYAMKNIDEEFYEAEDCKRDDAQVQYLFDAYNYPNAWAKKQSAWVRCEIELHPEENYCYFLKFEAVAPRCEVYLNGQLVAKSEEAMLPFEVEITKVAVRGINSLVVAVLDFERDKNGRTLTPSGNMYTAEMAGIWQDVALITRPKVFTSDVTVRTSVRNDSFTILMSMVNNNNNDSHIKYTMELLEWEKGVELAGLKKTRVLGVYNGLIKSEGKIDMQFEYQLDNLSLWRPDNPALYLLVIKLEATGQTHCFTERIGFRELWIEKEHFILNGFPLHIFSDWGHKISPYHHTENWIRQWYGMIKDGNMNHSRLHTHPHPSMYMDIADELGILITGETGIHGSGGDQAASEERYWQAAKQHIINFVKRDKNRPSVVSWSVENEMRWNGLRTGDDDTKWVYSKLPELRKLFNEIDPTRPAYHEGDSSLWDERTQDVISRHYGKECSGIGWWDHSKPLFAGELAIYHYIGPNNTVQIGGSDVYTDHYKMDVAAALDAAYIIEAGRTNDVGYFGPWNMSCLLNPRLHTEDIKLQYDDFSKKGVKPLYVKAHTSEFEFWKEGKGYHTLPSFEIQARAFRPLAVIDKSLNTQYFRNQPFHRRISIVNDTPLQVIDGNLVVRLKNNQTIYKNWEIPVLLSKGRVIHCDIDTCFEASWPVGEYIYEVEFDGGYGYQDSWSKSIMVFDKNVILDSLRTYANSSVGIYGDGCVKEILDEVGFATKTYTSVENLKADEVKVLVVEKNSVKKNDDLHNQLNKYFVSGGRVIVMEQKFSLFPKLPLIEKRMLTSFKLSHHPLLNNLSQDMTNYWGDDTFADLFSQSYVCERMYQKENGCYINSVLEVGEGSYGGGDLEHTVLFESLQGDGLIIANQMSIDEKISTIPATLIIVANMLQRAFEYEIVTERELLYVNNDLNSVLHKVKQGANAMVYIKDKNDLSEFSNLVGIELKGVQAEEYQLMKYDVSDELAGISNYDLCGVQSFSYTNDKENYILGRFFIQPNEKIEPLLTTAPHSVLKELFVNKGQSEPLRSYTVSKYLLSNEKHTVVALGKIKVGKGYFYLNCLESLENKHIKLERLKNRLIKNISKCSDDNVLNGDRSTNVIEYSKGYPEKAFMFRGNIQEGVIHSTKYDPERLFTTRIQHLPDGCIVEGENLMINTEELGDEELFAYFAIYTPAARKNVNTNLGIPNPDALTFCDFYGNGIVQMFIDEELVGECELIDGVGTIADISLETGYNHVIVTWKPVSIGNKLKISFRNINRETEKGFTFVL